MADNGRFIVALAFFLVAFANFAAEWSSIFNSQGLAGPTTLHREPASAVARRALTRTY